MGVGAGAGFGMIGGAAEVSSAGGLSGESFVFVQSSSLKMPLLPLLGGGSLSTRSSSVMALW